MSPAVTAAVDRFHAALRAEFGERLREHVLFGSYARGSANEESDVDLLVIIDDVTDSERRVVHDRAYTAGAVDDTLIVLSPLVYSTVHAADMRKRERRIMIEIARDGVVL